MWTNLIKYRPVTGKPKGQLVLLLRKIKNMDPRVESFGKLLKIMDELREKCPWDREQTFDTLRTLTLEETYELSDSII